MSDAHFLPGGVWLTPASNISDGRVVPTSTWTPGSLTAQQPAGLPRAGTVLLPGPIGDEAMTTNEPAPGPGLGPRKPRAELRHWSTYASVGDWYADYRGYLPIQQAAALGRLTRDGTPELPRRVQAPAQTPVNSMSKSP